MRRFWLAAFFCSIAVGLAAGLRWASAVGAAAQQAEDKETSTGASAGEGDSGVLLNPLGPNAACYVCHMTFVFEELARVHLVEKIACIQCHGLSAAHANDEDIGATKPDITYTREQVDLSCEKCHDTHDAAAREVVARWKERGLKDSKVVCTDCHGTHRIEEADTAPEEK